MALNSLMTGGFARIANTAGVQKKPSTGPHGATIYFLTGRDARATLIKDNKAYARTRNNCVSATHSKYENVMRYFAK